MLSDATVAAIAGAVTAVVGLVTSIHAHSKSTQANSTADAAHNYVKAVYDIGKLFLPLLLNPVSPKPGANGSATPVTDASTTVITDNESAILTQLSDWLRDQHTKTTGQSVGGPAVTDFSLVLNELNQIVRRVNAQ